MGLRKLKVIFNLPGFSLFILKEILSEWSRSGLGQVTLFLFKVSQRKIYQIEDFFQVPYVYLAFSYKNKLILIPLRTRIIPIGYKEFIEIDRGRTGFFTKIYKDIIE